MFQIVSNSLNSIDVDKFDYLARDCYNIGMKSSYDPSRFVVSRLIPISTTLYTYSTLQYQLAA
jgi:HD superfamily phosphohydrolase